VSIRDLQLQIKSVADWLGALVLLVALLPLILVIAFAIKAGDGGTVFFQQPRLGKSARVFTILKFRTMIEDADRFLDKDGFVTLDRVTSVGRILRRFSLDELPQLMNILKGEMSFIGPRPVLVSHFDRYTNAQRGRFEMKPGVTGLAQVSGRNELKWSKRIELDLEYIERFSLLLDVSILMRTLSVILSGAGQSMDRNAEIVDDLPPARDIRTNSDRHDH
jgi:lipopolysaccharide/colanic/teichoic acid biosynthesis glycosyltransferase